ncbi:hypothetical protein, partial [Mariniphaga sediminis]|uniref:hypothetical protein n=1 Tax=Mariniphaga sediminis TaxID=1628158 RepID=UPI00356561C5
QASTGKYSIAYIENGVQKKSSGTFTMTLQDKKVPMNNMSSTNSALNTSLILISIAAILSSLALFM